MGADMMRRDVAGSANIRDRRFRSWFGTSTVICAWGWHELESRGLPEEVEKKHYLWALTLMKTYETEANLSTKVGPVDEKTFREKAWLVVDLISWLELDLVSFCCTTNDNLVLLVLSDKLPLLLLTDSLGESSQRRCWK
jgi:hypothetical protein